MRLRSRFGLRAAKRLRRQELIARAPRVSPTIERSFATAFQRVMKAFSQRVQQRFAPQLRYDAAAELLSAQMSLAQEARQASAVFRETAFEHARRLEKFSKSEMGKSLGALASDLPTEVAGFADAFADEAVDRLEGLMGAALDAAFASVEGLESREVESVLASVLDGWISRAIQSARNIISAATTDLTKEHSQAAGVDGYYWITMHDAKVRPTHNALDDGDVKSWDDPPLKGSNADSGEDCHPGQDYECRCIAVPAVAEVQSKEEAQGEIVNAEAEEFEPGDEEAA